MHRGNCNISQRTRTTNHGSKCYLWSDPRENFSQYRDPLPLEFMPNTWERGVRGLGVLTVAAFFITAMTPLSNMIGRRMAVLSDHIEPSDAIIVLGSGVMGNGTLDT